ncbi:MAG: permease-like cell division protein FtsX [Clostridiales bacterium]|nr:permease-like cell division protein FtsX [Clostridiales bacterium]
MNAGSLRYLTKEGFRNVWVNRLMSIASVCVLMSCLVIIGIAFLSFANVQALLNKVDDENVIMVFVDNDLPLEDVKLIGESIKAIDNVGKCQYHSSEENSEDFYKSMDNQLLIDYFNEQETSTIPASFEIHLKDMSQFDVTLAKINNLNNIQYVRESRQLATFLVSLRSSVTYISVGAIALLLLISLFIISNTVRITMHSRRLEIGIMKNVGATNAFIRWPFLIEGMILGAISGVLALGAVYGIYELILKSLQTALSTFDILTPVPFITYCWWLLLGFEAVGIITGGFGSLISMKKYLKEKNYDDTAEDNE